MTILDDNRYVAENFYQQYIQRELLTNEVGEIELDVGVAPSSNYGWLIIEPNSNANREEIFYHRILWTSIFFYDINRTWAKSHDNWSMIVLNNTAWIYNFKEKDNENIFFSYLTWSDSLEIFWGYIVDFEWVQFEIQNTNTSTLSLTNNALNYIYVWTTDEWLSYELIATTIQSDDNFVVKEVTLDAIWNITLVEEWRQRWQWIFTDHMSVSIYDPTAVKGDAFSMGNMVETVTKKIFSDTERNKVWNITITNPVNLDNFLSVIQDLSFLVWEFIGNILDNTAKETNVSTNLSEGAFTLSTVDVNSSDWDNATLQSASTSRAGVMSKAKFDEVETNNSKVWITTQQEEASTRVDAEAWDNTKTYTAEVDIVSFSLRAWRAKNPITGSQPWGVEGEWENISWNLFLQWELVDKIDSNYTFNPTTGNIITDNNSNGKLGFLQEEWKTIEISGTTSNDGTYTIALMISENEIEVVESIVAETTTSLIKHIFLENGAEKWVEIGGNYYLQSWFSVNNIVFKYKEKRFYWELWEPNEQGWSQIENNPDSDISIVEKNVFGIDKNTNKFEDDSVGVKAFLPLTLEDWEFHLNNGLSFWGITNFVKDVNTNWNFVWAWFDSTNDPRNGSNVDWRFGAFISNDGDNIKITLEAGSGSKIFDWWNLPLITTSDFFEFQIKLEKTPDGGTNFGEIKLYVNGKLIDTGSVYESNNSINDKITTQNSSWDGETEFYYDNFGITQYLESNLKTLTNIDLAKNVTAIIIPPWIRDYIIEFPENILKDLWCEIILNAQNIGGTITLRNIGANVKWSFDWLVENTYPIDANKQIRLVNISEEKNIFMEFKKSSEWVNALGTHIIDSPADMDIIEVDPGDPTKIITKASFKLRTVTATNGVFSIKPIISIPVGTEVINTISAFSGGWLGVRDNAGTPEFFSKEKRLDFVTSIECPIGRADRTATDISAIVSLPELGFGYAQTLYNLVAEAGSKRLLGGDLQAVTSTKTLKRLEGTWKRPFANKDENNPHIMINDENNPVDSYEIHSSTGNVEILSEMEVGFIDDGTWGKTAIDNDEWSFYLCYHRSRFEGVGFEGFQRSTKSFPSLHNARSLKWTALGIPHPALDAAALTHIIYIKGDATDLNNPEQCSIEFVSNISSSGDPDVASLLNSGVISWEGTDILVQGTGNTWSTENFKQWIVIAETGVRYTREVEAVIDQAITNLATEFGTYVGYNFINKTFVQQAIPFNRIEYASISQLGFIKHEDKTTVQRVDSEPLTSNTLHDNATLYTVNGFMKLNGAILEPNSTDLSLKYSGLNIFKPGVGDSRDYIDYAEVAGATNVTWTPLFRTSGGQAQFGTPSNQIDITAYDDGSGILQHHVSPSWSNKYLALRIGSAGIDSYVMYGNNSYNSKDDALRYKWIDLIPPSDIHGLHIIASMVVQGSMTNFTTSFSIGDLEIKATDMHGI